MTAPLIDSPDYDYLPITGADLVLGDHVLWAIGFQFTVDAITQDAVDGGTRYTFSDAGPTVSAYAYHPAAAEPGSYTSTIYQVTTHPAVGAKFAAGDGSMWVFTASKAYRCWQAGGVYPVGSVVSRTELRLVPTS